MKKLSKPHETERSEHVANLREAQTSLEAAVEAFNSGLEELAQPVADAVERYNEALANAREFCEGVASEMESYYDERSEKWQDGDAGSNYSAWKDAWDDAANADDIAVDMPEPIEMLDVDHAETLDDLQPEPDA